MIHWLEKIVMGGSLNFHFNGIIIMGLSENIPHFETN